jgi:phosphoribosylformimino-5-aminoimidazole carboxamide ribotide isomerase
MTRFRPCIDLHAGQVKQIVGGTLSIVEKDLKTNYISTLPAGQFAKLYHDNDALGAHVIMLGPGNENAAKEALSTWPGHLQIGGGINDENAKEWIDAGAEKVGLSISSLNSCTICPRPRSESGNKPHSSFFSSRLYIDW